MLCDVSFHPFYNIRAFILAVRFGLDRTILRRSLGQNHTLLRVLLQKVSDLFSFSDDVEPRPSHEMVSLS